MKAKKVRVNKPNDNWWFIVAKDNSCQGYMPGRDEVEACKRFGLRVKQCSIKRVERTEQGFIWINQAVQRKLL